MSSSSSGTFDAAVLPSVDSWLRCLFGAGLSPIRGASGEDWSRDETLSPGREVEVMGRLSVFLLSAVPPVAGRARESLVALGDRSLVA